MTQYYYTCPIKAAYMAKYFGMVFLFQGVCALDSPRARDGYKAEIKIELKKGSCGIGDSPDYLKINFGDWAVPERHLIHPDSLTILEPMHGDVCEIDEGYDGHALVYRTAEELRGYKPKRIIQRNGVPFMWPEREE